MNFIKAIINLMRDRDFTVLPFWKVMMLAGMQGIVWGIVMALVVFGCLLIDLNFTHLAPLKCEQHENR